MRRTVHNQQIRHIMRLLKLIHHRCFRIVTHTSRAHLMNRPAFGEHLIRARNDFEFGGFEHLTRRDSHVGGHLTFVLSELIAEAYVPDEKTSWRKGLAAIGELLRPSDVQPADVLTKLAAKETDPQTEAEKFFTQLKQTTAFTYYSSSIGIHQEMGYLGNVILQEFRGYEAN